MELNMEEDSQVPSSRVNAKNNDRVSSYAVHQSIQKERPNLSSSLYCVLKLPPLYLEEHKLRAVKAHLSPSFVCLSIMVGLPFFSSFYPVSVVRNIPHFYQLTVGTELPFPALFIKK